MSFVDFLVADENGFTNELLDDFLAKGYYRMQHNLFTCNDTQIEYNSYSVPVFWLRTLVKKIKPHKLNQPIVRKCAAFTVEIKKAAITTEVEALYSLYRNHISFSAAESCEDYLHQRFLPNPFNSYMIEVRDTTTLIAVGYFDKGKNAIAGIINFYLPQYHKFSLGKFLMLQKINYALQNNIPYYYTGYISTAITKFNYKIFPDQEAIEVYLPADDKWIKYSNIDKSFLEDYYFNCLL
jgi:arginine-tRNA-protein transferase